MSGTIRGYVMSRAAESCKIIFDDDGRIADFICRRLDISLPSSGVFGGLGFLIGGRLTGGILFSDIKPGVDAWLSIFSDNKRWCSRRVLYVIFDIAFNLLKCRRLNALIDTDNRASLRLAEGVGFRREGVMRQYRENGRDVYVLGMLKNECNYLKEKENKNV